jgi:uncharacterized protein YxjI
MEIPPPVQAPPATTNLAATDPRYGHAKYKLKRQLLKLIGGGFLIYDPAGNLAVYVHQKGFKLKEDIRAYADEKMTQELFTIRARSIIDFSAAYDVVDTASGQKIGVLKRKGLKSILKDEWFVMDAADREIGRVVEDSTLLALLRRFATNLIPQSYDIELGGRKVADLRQPFNPFVYHLDIDLSPDPQRTMDRRLVFAVAVMLAAVEGRQSG